MIPESAPRSAEPVTSAPRLPGPGEVVSLSPRPGGPRAWAKAVRPRQWTKNLLVLAAPAAAGVLGRAGVGESVALAFVAFCLLASGAYLINDAHDAEEDRRHPVKRHRPVASGAISPTRARCAGVLAILLGLAIAAGGSPALVTVGAAYALLNAGYTTWLRRLPFVDMAGIAAAFVLRAMAGGAASGVAISRWFVLVVSATAVFVAAGKRYADLVDPVARRSRPVLRHYTERSLRILIAVSWGVALCSYAVWAIGVAGPTAGVARELTIVPFAGAMLRYGWVVGQGAGGAPEAVALKDPLVRTAGIAWLALFVTGV